MTNPVGRLQELTRAREHLLGTVPGSVLFTGEAGVGKSTVLDTTAKIAVSLRFDVHRSRAAASERDLPFVGLHDLLGAEADDVAVSLSGPLRRALDVVFLRADPPVGGTDMLATHLAILQVLQALVARRRLLLVLDDVQWLDVPSRLALEFAVRRLPTDRFGVVAALRGPSPGAMALLPEPCLTIEIGPLSAAEIADVVAQRLGRMPTPQRVVALFRASAGNPLLAVELARMASGMSARIEAFPVPERYLPVISARLARLSQLGNRTLLGAALVSRPTSLLLERIGGREGIAEVEAAGILRRDGDSIEFEHPLVADVCRMNAGPSRVTDMHRELVAAVGDLVEKAKHLALCTPHADAQVAGEVERASHAAADRAALATAGELAQQALRLTPSDATTDGVRRAMSASDWLNSTGDQVAAADVLRPLIDTLTPGELRARCLVALSDTLEQDVTASLPVLREALAQPGLAAGTAVEAQMRVALSLMIRGDLHEARREASMAAARAEAAGLKDLAGWGSLVDATVGLFVGSPLADSTAWIATRTHAWEPASAYDHPDCVLAWEMSWRDHQSEAARLLDGLLNRAIDRGELFAEGGLALHRSEVAIRAGDLDQAASLADRCYRLNSNGTRDQCPLYVRAHVAAWQGRLEEARSLSQEGLTMAVEADDALFRAQCTVVLAFLEVSACRYVPATQYAIELRDLLNKMNWGHPGCFRWQADAVEAFLATDRVEDANTVTAELWGQADRLALNGCRALAARCDGLLLSHAGDHKRAEDRLTHSLALMDGLDMPLERARSLFILGIVRRRARQKAAARRPLEEARNLFATAGALAWVDRANEELTRAVGSHAGQALTASERSIAELVAAGQTNREIAARLFLSSKTVETVLTRVYRKLGVRSRTDLARLLSSKDATRGHDEGNP